MEAVRPVITVRSAKRGLGSTGTLRALVRRCVEKTLELEKVDFRCEVAVTLTDDAGIRALNTRFRAKDAPTDVLSFPMLDWTDGHGPRPGAGDTDPVTQAVPLGDVVISLERARAQAEEFGHSPERECGFLVVHSALHLLGYDHEQGEERRRLMRGREEAVLEALGLTRPESPEAYGDSAERKGT